MKKILFFLFFILPILAWSQYPGNARKQRLGYQTTGAGLVYIKSGAPAHTPANDEDTWMVLDTTNNILYYWDEPAGAWENLLDDVVRDTVFQITNVPDTSALVPLQGDIFINTAKDTVGFYTPTGWVLFFRGLRSNGLTLDFVGRYDGANGLVNADIEDDGTTVTIGFLSASEVDILPTDTATIGGAVSRLGGQADNRITVDDDTGQTDIVAVTGVDITAGSLSQNLRVDDFGIGVQVDGGSYYLTGGDPPVDGKNHVQAWFNGSAQWLNLTDSLAAAGGGGGGGGHIIADEGSALTTRDTLDFQGAGVTVTDGTTKTIVTISGDNLGDHTATTNLNMAGNTILGGTGTGSDLILQSTSGVGGATSEILFLVGNNGGTEAMRIDGTGEVGIGTSTPAQTLHVSGTARITGSDGIGTRIMLRDADGDISDATLGTGLTLTAGELSATGGSGGGGSAIYVQSSAPSDTLSHWIDNTAGAGKVWDVYKRQNGAWVRVGWYDSVGDVFSAQPPVYVLASGQSNMVGFHADGLGDLAEDNRVIRWNVSTQVWEVYPVTTTNYIDFQFAKQIATRENRIVRVVKAAQGSTAVNQWEPGNTMADSVINVSASAGVTDYDVLCWHQGESDAGGTLSAYYTSFNSFLGMLADSSLLDREEPVILGGIFQSATSGVPEKNEDLEYIAETSIRIGFAESDNLSSPDNLHFRGSAIDTLGARYYREYKALPRSKDTYQDVSTTSITAGYKAGYKATGANAIYVGKSACENCSGTDLVAIGNQALQNVTTATYTVGVGTAAGRSNNTNYGTHIGYNAGLNSTQERATNVGYYAGGNHTGLYTTNFGALAGWQGAGDYVTNLGYGAGSSSSVVGAVNIGYNSGSSNAGDYAVNIGYQAGQNNSAAADNTVNIGRFAGQNCAGGNTLNIGYYAGRNAVAQSINIGNSAGENAGNVLGSVINIGNSAGYNLKGQYGIAIGDQAMLAQKSGGSNAIGIGRSVMGSATDTTATATVAIGSQALEIASVADNIVAIGHRAGRSNAYTYTTIIGAYQEATQNGEIALGAKNTTGGVEQSTVLRARNYKFNIDQTVGAGQDNYVLTYDNATGEIGLEAGTTDTNTNIANTNLTADGNRTLDMNGNQLAVSNAEYISLTGNDGGVSADNAQLIVYGNNTNGIYGVANTSGQDSYLQLKGTDFVVGDGALDTTKSIKYLPYANYLRLGNWAFQVSDALGSGDDGALMAYNDTNKRWEAALPSGGELYTTSGSSIPAGSYFAAVTGLTSARLVNFTATDSTLTYTGTKTKDFLIQYDASVTLTTSGSGAFLSQLVIHVDDVEQARTRRQHTVNAAGAETWRYTIAGHQVITLAQNQVVKLKSNNTAGATFTASYLNLTITEKR